MYKNRKKRSGITALIALSQSAKQSRLDEASNPPQGVLTERNKPTDNADEDIFGSQSYIPSSQPQSQRRYVSQRSNMNVALSQMVGSIPGPGSSRVPDTYYEYILQKSGVKSDQPDNYVIDCDHIQFVSKLRKGLQASPEYPANLSKFVKGFKTIVADDNLLAKTLSVCMVVLPNSIGLPQSQESLMKNLLMIDFLQEELVAALLEKMQELSERARNDEMVSNILVMCLSQLKFINKMKHGCLVFTKIVDILESSHLDVKLIVIRHLDDVIEAKRHNEIVRKLMEILKEDSDFLNPFTLDAFENMCLSTALLGELKDRIFQYIEREDPISLYPKFMKLLLKYNDENCLPELIDSIRKQLKWRKGTRRESIDSKKSVISIIKTSLMRSAKLSDLWVKSIKVSLTSEEHYPLDFVVLVTIMETNDERSSTIESLIRKKFTEGLFTKEFLKDVVRNFPEFVVDNLGIFLDIADHLFRNKEKIWEIGKLAFKFAFGIEASNKKMILSKLVGLVCEKTEADVKTRALVMLSEIRTKYFAQLQNNGMQLLLIQENIGDIGLMQYRILMDILCSIAYPLPPYTPPEEIVHEIDMLVKKQLANSSITTIRLGIIGAVKTIGHLVWHSTEEEALEGFDPNQSINFTNEFPDGPLRDAAVLVQIVEQVASNNCADSLAMCYDELALVFSPRSDMGHNKKFPNKKFLNWLSESLVDNFSKYFTTDAIPLNSEMEFIQKYCLFSEKENEKSSVNIGGLTINPPKTLESSITVLCPMFNLLRVLRFRNDNCSLESLYKVCGFGVILPSYIGSMDDLDIFDEFEQATSKMILDMFFHTANWFREIIGAFSSQQEPLIRQQVLTRLTDLIKIEDHIRCLLRLAPTTYIAPNATFIATQDKGQIFKKPAPVRRIASSSRKKTSKKVGNAADESESILSAAASKTQDVSTSSARSEPKHIFLATCYGPRENYRQMDLNILLLLENQLITEHSVLEDRIGSCIGLQEYRFIVDDLVLKLESFVGSRKAHCHNLQIITSPEALIHDLVAMLPQIQQHFTQIVNELSRAVEASEEILESHHLYTENVNSLKLCFAISLNLYATLFAWPGFSDDQALLRKALQVISESSETDIKDLASEAVKSFMKHTKLTLEIKSSLQLVHLVGELTKITADREEDQDALRNLSEELLSKRWYTVTGAIEKGGEFNVFLAELLKGVFRGVEFKQLSAQIVWIRREILLLKRRDDTLKTYPGFSKNNFTILFRGLCAALVDVLMRQLGEKLSHSGNLKMWENVISILDTFRAIVRDTNNSTNNLVYMKNANTILKTFLQHGIPLIQECLKKRQGQCMAIIKELQDTTRFLNSLCCHSKIGNQTAVAAQIPLVRETLEKLVFHVKTVLTTNKCSSAFWVGILRNRDIHGEVIQRKKDVEDSDDSDKTEELIPDEDDDMSELIQDDEEADSRSCLL
ncbi:Fanconi anemia group D2 protein [Sergentomyia squamirostris]